MRHAATMAGLLVGMCCAHAHAEAAQPRRVVSMNVCTDQMAIMLAAPGQLHSVSYLATDTGSSVLADEASGYAVNHGLAEEIFLMEPDLVLAGTYTTRATVSLLRRLGIPVEEFAPENSLADIRTNLARMGEVLGRQDKAASLIGELDRRLAAAVATNEGPGRTVATYYANSYTSGSGTLVDSIIVAAGLENIASRLGYAGTAQLPLEVLILQAPDILVDGGRSQPMPALAQQNYLHPAYRQLAEKSVQADVPARYTICGGPFTAEAVRLLRDAAKGPAQ